MAANLTIKTLSEKTGLSPHTIRAWERRYSALQPARTDTNRRLYEESDVARLRLLARLVDDGYSIGQIGRLSTSELEGMVVVPIVSSSPVATSTGNWLADAQAAAIRLDEVSLEAVVHRAAADLGVRGLLDQVVLPFVDWLGSAWSAGEIGIAQEHLATAVLRTSLERIRLGLGAPPGAPKMLVTTPVGQYHEVGAIVVAITATLAGWSVVYLGPNLPAGEIAASAHRLGVRAVGLSIVYPPDDPSLAEELLNLRTQLGSIPILVGGRSAWSYIKTLNQVQATLVPSLPELDRVLSQLSTRP